MKPSISKKTQEYLDSLEKRNDQADFYAGQMDIIDRLIYENGLRIKDLYFDKELDLMLIILNNRKVMKRSMSISQRLNSANEDQLRNFENDGTGIHWPGLDEDLSLRGFLSDEIISADLTRVA